MNNGNQKKTCSEKGRMLSLFANVGIAETYLPKIGFKSVVFNELEPERARFYSHFNPHSLPIIGSITDPKVKKQIIEKAINQKVNVIMATPPCQGFSVAGKRNANDPRNTLMMHAVEIIEKLKPDYVLVENVVQYFRDEIEFGNLKGTIPALIAKKLSNDYYITQSIVDSASYGVPQTRRRGIMLMTRKNLPKWEIPTKKAKIKTVREAIGHLPSLEPISRGKEKNPSMKGNKNHTPPIHNEMHIRVMSHTPTGKSALFNKKHYPVKENGQRIKGYGTTYKRMSWDKPAPTITMMNGSISSQNNVHPGRKMKNGTYSDPRVLTLREIFILSSLPENWKYPSWAKEGFIRKIIGEGVPPLMIKKIFENIPN